MMTANKVEHKVGCHKGGVDLAVVDLVSGCGTKYEGVGSVVSAVCKGSNLVGAHVLYCWFWLP
jgi:hypothetical protein